MLLLPLLAPLIPTFFWAASSEVTKQIWLALSLSFSALFLGVMLWRQKKIEVHYNKKLLMLAAVFALSVAISTALSQSPYKSFFGSFDRLQGAVTYLLYALWAVILMIALAQEKLRRQALLATFLVGAVSALHGITQYFTGEIPRLFDHRIFAAMGNPTSLGQFLIFPFFAGLWLFESTHKKSARVGVLLALLAIFTGLILTGNRASILGVMVGVLILCYKKQVNKKKKLFTIGTVLLGLVMAIVFVNPGLRSLNTRRILWPQTIQLIPEQPFFGSGNETYEQRALPTMSKELYYYESTTTTADRPHNSLLEAGVHRGLIGMAFALIPLIFLIILMVSKQPLSPPALASLCALIAYNVGVQFGFSLSVHITHQILFWGVLLYELPHFFINNKNGNGRVIGFILCAAGLMSLLYGSLLLRNTQRYEAALYNPTEPRLFIELLETSPRYEAWYFSFFKLYYKTAAKNAVTLTLLETTVPSYSTVFHYPLYESIFEGYVAAAKRDRATLQSSLKKALMLAPNWPELQLIYKSLLREVTD